MFHSNKNNKFYKDNLQQHCLTEHNTYQDQPEFERDIFQPNVRQHSKESTFAEEIKNFVGYLKNNKLERQHTLKTTVVGKLHSLNQVYREVLCLYCARSCIYRTN